MARDLDEQEEYGCEHWNLRSYDEEIFAEEYDEYGDQLVSFIRYFVCDDCGKEWSERA